MPEKKQSSAKIAKDVDEYIRQAPDEVRPKLEKLRELIKKLAPQAEERIGYGIPGYYLNGPLVYFGGFTHHVSLYGTASRIIEQFKEELKPYKQSKGTIQFPLDQPLPEGLITKIVRARVKENEAKGSQYERSK